MTECPHYSHEFDCPRHCSVAEVGGRHLDLHDGCLVAPIRGEGRHLKDWPELCYRYQRARADALAAELAEAKVRLAELEEAGEALATVAAPSLSKYWPEDLARWRALRGRGCWAGVGEEING